MVIVMCLVGWCSDEWEFGVQYNWVIGEPNEKIMRGMFWNDCLVIWVDESEWAVFRFVLMHPLHSRWVGPTKLWGCCSALAMTEISCDGQTAQHFHSVCVCVCVCVYVKSSPVCWPSWHCYIVGMHAFQTLYYLVCVWLCGNILGCLRFVRVHL